MVAVCAEKQLSQLALEEVSASDCPATEPLHEVTETVTAQDRQHATEQLTTTPETTESSAKEATAAAVPTGKTLEQTQPDPRVVPVCGERQLPQLALKKVSASACTATEQQDEHIEGVTPEEQSDEQQKQPDEDAEEKQPRSPTASDVSIAEPVSYTHLRAHET